MRRSNLCLFAIILVAIGAVSAQAELIWDNYLSNNPGYDGTSYFSSERCTSVPDSWAGDDAVWETTVTISAIEWLGARKPGYDYGYAEAIILDSDFQTLYEFTIDSGQPLDYTAEELPGPVFGWMPYEGYVEIPETTLLAGQYYIAVRLVSAAEPGDATTAGRNVVLTTGNGGINGDTMGVIKNVGLGADDWMLVDNYFGTPATDYSYRIYGVEVPEPAGLLLLVSGLLLGRRRL